MTDATTRSETLTILLDGREVQARPGELVITAAERAGTFVPRFCYHPRMKPVGMCRMCLVEIKGPRGFSLQPACFVSVADGQEIVTDSDKVRKAQDGVLEYLLINHPLDCPVCDKGGECPLQDQTLSYGPGESRFIEEKRHWEKPIAISDLIYLDRERCIQCARCTRFAEEVAGEAQIDFHGRGDHVEVNIFPGTPFTSYFSGNTVQICPVGALTAVPYRFRARPWDVEQVESTCTSCALGCRVVVQSSSNQVIRYLGVDSDPVNWSWMCDKGRFDFEAINSSERVTTPLVRESGQLVETTWADALARATEAISAAMRKGPSAIGVIGGARLANEDAYAWSKLAKSIIGTDSVDAQLGDGLPAEAVLGLPRATIDQACSADRVVLLSGDLREELPVLFLRMRHAATESGLPIVELSPVETSMSEHAALSLYYRPGEVGDLARALVASSDPGQEVAGAPAEAVAAARRVLGPIGGGGSGVVVVLGRPSLAESGASVAAAAAELAAAWPNARFLTALRRANVHGALDMGLAPGILPGRVSLDEARDWYSRAWARVPDSAGLDTAGMLIAAAEGRIETLVLLGADPLSDFPDRQLATEALGKVGHVVAVDCFLNDSSGRADVVLPAAMYAERAGTTTNLEGRVSRLGQKVVSPGVAWPDWMIASELAARLGGDLGFDSIEGIWDEIERTAPSHRGVTSEVLDSDAGRDGVVVPLEATPVRIGAPGPNGSRSAAIDPMATPGIDAVERQGAPSRVGPSRPARPLPEAAGAGSQPARPSTLRLSGPVAGVQPPAPDAYSLRLVATRRLYDRATMTQASAALAPLAPEAVLRANSYDLDRLGVSTGDRVRIRSNRASLVLPVAAHEGTPRGSAAVDFNLSGSGAADLIDATATATDVRMETSGD